MAAMLAGGVRRQKCTHAKLDLARKVASEATVKPANHVDRIPDQIRIFDIKKGVRAKALPGGDESVKRFLPMLRHFGSNRCRIDKITEDAAKRRGKAGYRREDLQGFPMHLYDQCVRIGGEERLYGRHVGWRLEHIAAGGSTILQLLEKLSVKFIHGSHVLSFQPRLVSRNVVHRGELIAHEGMAHDRDALLRKMGRDRMDFLKIRSQQMKAEQPLLRSSDSAFLPERWRWRRKHHLPGSWSGECFLVLGKKSVQQCRPGAWQSENKNGCDNCFLVDQWPLAAVVLNFQAVGQKLQYVLL